MWILALSEICSAQRTASDFSYGAFVGGNFSRFSPAIDFPEFDGPMDRGPGFHAGLFGKKELPKLGERFSLAGAAHYSLLTGIVRNPFYRMRNQYIGGFLGLQYKIADDLHLTLGANGLYLLNSRLFQSRTLERESGQAGSNFWGFRNEINPMIGAEVRLSPNAQIALNYIHPVSSRATSNIQLSLLLSINTEEKRPSDRLMARSEAFNQIGELRSGVLLVRLATGKNKIEALTVRGRAEEADRLKTDLENMNRTIMRAFKNNYNFSRVEFFYSDDSRKVREGRYEGIFLDDNLQPDSSISIRPLVPVYIAEFGSVSKGTGGSMSFSALVIMDRQFNTLEKPFPYYARALHAAVKSRADRTLVAFPLLPFTTATYEETVAKWNRSLREFYARQGMN